METDFESTQAWLLANASILMLKASATNEFKDVIYCVNTLTDHAPEFLQVYNILQLSREQLPGYLSSSNKYYRAAAVERMRMLW